MLTAQLVLPVVARRRLDKANVMEHNLTLIDGSLVEHLGRDVFGCKVDALAARLLQHGGEETHFELKRQNVDAGGTALTAFGDDLFDEEPAYRQIDRTDNDEPAIPRAVKEAILRTFVAARPVALYARRISSRNSFSFCASACSFCAPVSRPPTFR